MRFYGKGFVWDVDMDKPIEFVGGTFDTNDERVQKILINAGCKHADPDPPKDPLEDVTEASVDMKPKDIREIGRRKGLTFRVGTTKEDMVKAINEKV